MKKATLEIDIKKDRAVICDELSVKIEGIKRWKAIPPYHLKIVYENNKQETYELENFSFNGVELYSQYSPTSKIIVRDSQTKAKSIREEENSHDKGVKNIWSSFQNYKGSS